MGFVNYFILGIIILLGLLIVGIIVGVVLKTNRDNRVEEKNHSLEEVKYKQINEEKTVSAMEEVLKAMQKDLENQKQNPVEVFEREQEEKAIISYQELLKIKKNHDEKEVDTPQHATSVTRESRTPIDDNHFTKTEVISPIFGRMEAKMDYPTVKKDEPKHMAKEPVFDEHELERTLNIEPLSEEIKKNDEFLKALKEFRSKL